MSDEVVAECDREPEAEDGGVVLLERINPDTLRNSLIVLCTV